MAVSKKSAAQFPQGNKIFFLIMVMYIWGQHVKIRSTTKYSGTHPEIPGRTWGKIHFVFITVPKIMNYYHNKKAKEEL